MLEIRTASVRQLLAQFSNVESSYWHSSEQDRLLSIRSLKRRDEFHAAHRLARMTLAETLGGSERDWKIESHPDSAPRVAGMTDVHLSLAHSQDMVMCAISSFPIGVDIESMRRKRNFVAIAKIAFSSQLLQNLSTVSELDRAALFYHYWTLTEAWFKWHSTRDCNNLPSIFARKLMISPSAPILANAITWMRGDFTFSVVSTSESGFLHRKSIVDSSDGPSFWSLRSAA